MTAVLALILALLAGPAAAHGTLPGGTGFQAGALHPLAATEHLVALIAAGMGLGRAHRGAVAAGVAALLAGLVAGLWQGGLLPPMGAVPILLAALALGGLLASGRGIALGLIAPVLVILGWAIGADTDMPEGAGMAARAGVLAAAALIVLNLAALAQWAGDRWPLAPRVAGSWIVAVALLVLALQAAPAPGLVAALP